MFIGKAISLTKMHWIFQEFIRNSTSETIVTLSKDEIYSTFVKKVSNKGFKEVDFRLLPSQTYVHTFFAFLDYCACI